MKCRLIPKWWQLVIWWKLVWVKWFLSAFRLTNQSHYRSTAFNFTCPLCSICSLVVLVFGADLLVFLSFFAKTKQPGGLNKESRLKFILRFRSFRSIYLQSNQYTRQLSYLSNVCLIQTTYFKWCSVESLTLPVSLCSNASEARRFCHEHECPSNWNSANEINCCVYHANIHSCPLGLMVGASGAAPGRQWWSVTRLMFCVLPETRGDLWPLDPRRW